MFFCAFAHVKVITFVYNAKKKKKFCEIRHEMTANTQFNARKYFLEITKEMADRLFIGRMTGVCSVPVLLAVGKLPPGRSAVLYFFHPKGA